MPDWMLIIPVGLGLGWLAGAIAFELRSRRASGRRWDSEIAAARRRERGRDE